MIRFKDWKHSLHTWSTACCLRRDCSRVDRVWFRERWSDCIAAAAEASTWLFSSSPSSWRTTSDSCAVFKSVSTSCGNTLHKGVKTLYSADVTLPWFKGGMKWPNTITIWKTCVYYCISMPVSIHTLYEKEMTARIKKPMYLCTEEQKEGTTQLPLNKSELLMRQYLLKKTTESTEILALSSGSPRCGSIHILLDLPLFFYYELPGGMKK